jgi:hypothetical protein
MKKVIFIQKEKGCASLESKAEALRKHAHLEKITRDPLTGNTIKLYSMAAMHDLGLCAEVTIAAGRVVSVRNIPESAIKATAFEFGGF